MSEQDKGVQLLLGRASEQVAEPDFADRVWADARRISRRRRRTTAAVGSVAVVALIAAGVVAGPQLKRSTDQVAPSPNPLPSATITVPPAGEIDGTPYWLGPEAGSEPWLDGMPTVLGAQLGLPDGRIDALDQRPIRQVAVVLLRETAPGRFHPLVRSMSGRWAQAAVELVPTKDAAGKPVQPLNSTSVAPSGAKVAFAQPDKVVVLDTATGRAEEIPVPSATIDHVAWTTTSDRLFVSGPQEAYRVIVGTVTAGEQRVIRIPGTTDPSALSQPLALDSDATGPMLVSYDPNGHGRLVQRPRVPVAGWIGATFSSGGSSARFGDPQSTPNPSRGARALAVVGAQPGSPRKLLMLPDALKEIRDPGSGVLGWYDDHTVLFESRTKHYGWVMAWNLQTGQLLRVTELEVDAVALGPNLVR